MTKIDDLLSHDRDSLQEIYAILEDATESRFPLTAEALPMIRSHFDGGCDIYLRRRLSVCRMLIDLHLPLSDHELDAVLGAALSRRMPGDSFPVTLPRELEEIFSKEPLVAEILSGFPLSDPSSPKFFEELVKHPYPLIIRLTERSVLMEKLYEWDPDSAKRYIQETHEHFFTMCIYAKEHYPELHGAATLLMEKTRNLLMVNEILLNRYEDEEAALRLEILMLREENASIRAMIHDIRESR